ncbi:MAG: hypothetical protein EZS28_006327 [Streblomastix strix]|uniref:Uncharacterized protein n=1 Tax=Streblomastix strix TaxID=222440 RepID=A0A5J4WSM2_9EUKA|nr:MAG: hypothetical protein EZS28_006327 [Streblomastix strix]
MIEDLRNQFIAIDPKLKGKIDYEGIRNFQVIRRGQIAREPDFNIDARLAELRARTGNAALPPDPNTLLKEVSEEVPKEYVSILQQEDGEQQLAQAIPKKDAIQQLYKMKYRIQRVNLCKNKCCNVNPTIR